MRVLYDHQAFTMQDYGGISRYFYELALQLEKTNGLEVYHSTLFSNNEYIRGCGAIRSTPFFKGLQLQKKTELMQLINELKSSSVYDSGGFDVFHPTYYDPYYLKMKKKRPAVITFHDLIHEKFMTKDRQTLANKKEVLNQADAIIAISGNSKIDLMNYYGIPEERIKVIRLASSMTITDLPNETCKENYLLYVGNRDHYKNFKFFVKAIAPLLLKNPDLFLFCVGGGAFSGEELTTFHRLGIQRKVKYYLHSDERLRRLYLNALAFLFPSLYEGFGIPLLEAMNCGCPIGASQTSSLPEVAGDAALYFDPYDGDSILSVAEVLVNQSGVRSMLKQRGERRAPEFSWARTGQLTNDLYKSLI